MAFRPSFTYVKTLSIDTYKVIRSLHVLTVDGERSSVCMSVLSWRSLADRPILCLTASSVRGRKQAYQLTVRMLKDGHVAAGCSITPLSTVHCPLEHPVIHRLRRVYRPQRLTLSHRSNTPFHIFSVDLRRRVIMSSSNKPAAPFHSTPATVPIPAHSHGSAVPPASTSLHTRLLEWAFLGRQADPARTGDGPRRDSAYIAIASMLSTALALFIAFTFTFMFSPRSHCLQCSLVCAGHRAVSGGTVLCHHWRCADLL